MEAFKNQYSAELIDQYSFKFKCFQRINAIILRRLQVVISRYPRLKIWLRGMRRTVLSLSHRDYTHWVRQLDTLTEDDEAAIRRHIGTFRYKPILSVVMPVYNTPIRWLSIAIESVLAQFYPHWELCIADDASTEPDCRRVLEEYMQRDARIKVVFREQNGHISEASNSALELATGDFTVFMDHDDKLPRHSLYMVAEALNRNPGADLLYSDEDKIDRNDRRYDPYFKPDWNPDLLLSQNFVCHLGVYRTSLIKRLGGFRNGFVGSQDHELALRVASETSADRIVHIPHVLYHWREVPGSTSILPSQKGYAWEAGKRAIQSHLRDRGIEAEVLEGFPDAWYRVKYALPRNPPPVSLVIPTTGAYPRLLEGLIRRITKTADFLQLEVILVANNTKNKDSEIFLHELPNRYHVRLLQYPERFNFSSICNFGIAQANGEIIGLLNDDLEIISDGWLAEMVSHAVRPDIGAVGAMLYYPDDTIQHAGVILGLGGVAGHAHHGFSRGEKGYYGRAGLIQNFSAVTAACMMMRRTVFDEVGGFDERLAVAFNDVDLCIRIRDKGYRILWTPYAEFYHYESLSRGPESTPERFPKFIEEIEYMQNKWGVSLFNDPCYNPNLSLCNGRFELCFSPRVKKPWRGEG